MRTHASKPNHFGSWVLWDWVSSINSTYFSFNITVSDSATLIQEYRVRTWHSDPRIPCRNVTLRSKNTVSKRDTPIQEYRVGTWHSDPRILCQNVTLRSYNNISLSFNITTLPFVNNISLSLLYSRHHFNRDGLRLYIPRSRDFRPITKHTTKPHNHTIKYIENFTISSNAYQSLFRVYYEIT